MLYKKEAGTPPRDKHLRYKPASYMDGLCDGGKKSQVFCLESCSFKNVAVYKFA